MKKKMLITGARRGVGLACAIRFKDRYDVITTDRDGDVTVKGDLRDRRFLKHLVDTYDINVLLNVAGVVDVDMADVYDVDYIAPVFLSLWFYEKMTEGNIINVSSGSATNSGWVDMPFNRLTYNTAKAGLKKFTNVLQNSKKKRVKVTSLEPAQMNTQFGGPLVNIPESEYARQTMPLVKMKPEYVAEVIEWILNQPDPVVVATLELQNLRVPETPKPAR